MGGYIYDILFKAAAETLTTTAADPKHLGARIGLTSVLHTLGLGAHPPSAVSSLGGFPTPAAGARGTVRSRPASENLHRNGPSAAIQ
jgi:hypothetical protein